MDVTLIVLVVTALAAARDGAADRAGEGGGIHGRSALGVTDGVSATEAELLRANAMVLARSWPGVRGRPGGRARPRRSRRATR